jgi:hypothetical protein
MLSAINFYTIGPRRNLLCTLSHTTNHYSRLESGSTATAGRHAVAGDCDIAQSPIVWVNPSLCAPPHSASQGQGHNQHNEQRDAGGSGDKTLISKGL